ncbi:uncharacterized protein LOC114431928 [Parambassis ranga]|uniref:Uncharacterized protein LOC114431928 n=1 Tax=Parambassis ranga TaxID=210632 RepID=A0A6P7HNP0_9TELE|nr:uncharacterized protein LOC114431928 [Parambassis ranga]
MAFANLFTKLCASRDDIRTPEQPAVTHRNNTEDGARGTKRKTEAEQAGFHKKRHNQGQLSFNKHHRTQSADGESAPGYNKKVFHYENEGHKAGCHKGQNNKNIHNCKVKKQRHPEGRRNWHQRTERGRHARGDGGRYKKPFDDARDVKHKRTFSMTQEFMDQNALLVDGRLICRHFVWGRCHKADECQLEHIQGYNGLLKEVCKFYVQECCTKGESCPYMHKSFPCKFYHSTGKCFQGDDCRFSHEPLTELTKQLLDQALKRSELCEVAKKGQQEPAGQPVGTDPASEVKEAKLTPDLLLQPLRPNFYNSTATCAEQETCQAEEQEEAIPPQTASDGAQPRSPPSATPNSEELVCYSVEAMLGPQLSRPFFSFYTAPGSPSLSDPQTTCDTTPSAPNKSEAPYSVEAVLKSCTSVEKSALGQTFHTPPTTKTLSYYPLTHSEKVTDPLLHSEYQDEKKSLKTKVHKENLSSIQPSVVTEAEKSKHKDMKESRPLPADGTASLSSDSHALLPVGPTESKPSEQTCASKHVPAQTVAARSSFNSFPFSAHHLAAEGLGVVEQRYKKTQSGLNVQTQRVKSERTSAERSSKMTDTGTKRPFQSLFAGLIADDPETPTPDSASDFTEPSQSAGLTRRDADEGEPRKTSGTSFLSLFSTPLKETAAAAPPLSPDSRQKTSSSEPSLPRQVRTGTQDSPRPENDTPAEVPGPDPSAALVQQQPPGLSSPGAASSVLKSLFLCLSPYQEDGEQQKSSDSTLPQMVQQKCARGPTDLSPVPSQAAGGSTLSCAGMTEAQVRNSATQHLPFKLTTPQRKDCV